MEATVKHRIVGSLMLLSLCVIILPFWLDGAGLKDYQATQTQKAMPLAQSSSALELADTVSVTPNLDPSDIKVIELSPILTTKESSNGKPAVTDQALAANTSTSTANKTKPELNDSLLNAQGLPNGWVVQLGSFGIKSNAVRLRDKVIKAGYPAYMIPSGTLFKVMVGPELNRPQAQALQKQLKVKFKMTGMVTLYKVAKP